MDSFLTAVESDDPSTFETNKQEWEKAKQDGAVAAEVAIYSDTATDCDAALHSGDGQVSSPTSRLLVSIAEQFKDASTAANAFDRESIWGISGADLKKTSAPGTVEGSGSGLGSNSIAWTGSFFGAPFYVAFWQNQNLVLFVLASNIPSDQSKEVAIAQSRRIGQLKTAPFQSAPSGGVSAPNAPGQINCSLTSVSHPRVVAIASGSDSLALKSDGSVWTWGQGDKGQLGTGSSVDSNRPEQVKSLNCVVAIAAGADHDLALRTDGSVWAWGGNTRGQLGNGTGASSDKPVAVHGLASGVVAIAAGDETGLALKSDGSVWAWGRNDRGQLGDGKTSDSAVPVAVTGLSSGVSAVAAGDDYGFAMKTDGSVWGWGNNFSGQLGSGPMETITVPAQVNGLAPGVMAISAGGGHVLALMANGSLVAWGKNTSGELGNGSTNDTAIPNLVSGFSSGVIAIAAGTDDDSFAVKSDGSVWAWGWGAACQLGNGSPNDRHVPTQVKGLATGVVAVAAGSGGALALKSDGSLWAWGTNNHGELGNGVTDSEGGSCVPVSVIGLT